MNFGSFENSNPVESSKENIIEKDDITKTEFFITDHSLRHPETVSPERIREMYRELKNEGIKSVRFDWDWDKVFPESGKVNDELQNKYIETIKIMKEEGMEPPTLVLSTPPEWANKLIKEKNFEEYFQSYKKYTDSVAEIIKKSGLEVNQAQLFNEINHPAIFNFFGDFENFPKISQIARNSFNEKDLDVKLSTSIIVGNISEKLSGPLNKPDLDKFLDEFEKVKDCVDVISIDYYPGMWHFPIQGVKEKGDAFPIKKSFNPIKELGNKLNRTFKNIDLLKSTCERLSKMGKDYEFGEAGFPTNEPYSNGRRQRLHYDMYFRALRQMFVDFDSRGIKLPKRIGIYEAQDEDNSHGLGLDKNSIHKWINSRKIFPESHFGLYNKEEEKKEILQGNLKGEPKESEDSQLKKLIQYVTKPIEK